MAHPEALKLGMTDRQYFTSILNQPMYDGEGNLTGYGPTGNQGDMFRQYLQVMDEYKTDDWNSIPVEARSQVAGGVWKPGTGVFKGFFSSPAVWLAAGGLGAMAGAGGAAGAGAAESAGAGAAGTAGTAGTIGGLYEGSGLAAELAAGGAGASAAAPAAAAAGGLASGAGGGTALGSGITASAPAQTAMGAGALGSGITTGTAPATTGAAMASTGGGFLGLSTGDWVNLGTQLGGALLSSNAAKDASRDQTAASNAAIAESRRQYDTTRSDLAPWLQQGTAAVGRLGDLLGISGNAMTPEQIMAQDPGYQFRLDEGNKALTNRLSSMGLRNSGSALKAGTRYAQDYASGEYGNIYNRLAGVAGTGQTAGTNLGQFGAQNANTVGNLMTGAANARGAAAISGANAWGNAAQNIGNWYSQNSMLDKVLNNRSYGGSY